IVGHGEVWCWGRNDKGQLGTGTVGGSEDKPVEVVGLAGPATMVAAGKNFSCAVIGSTGVECWGENNRGQLGRGTTGGNSGTRAFVSGLGAVISIDGGDEHACAVTTLNAAVCWGHNDKGQLGALLGADSNTPTLVGLLSSYTMIAAGAK